MTPSPREEGGEGPIAGKVSKNEDTFLGHLCGPVGVWGSQAGGQKQPWACPRGLSPALGKK